MKKTSIFSLMMVAGTFLNNQVNAQAPCLSGGCFVSVSSNLTTICAGRSVVLTADSGSALLQNDFNTSTLGQGWVTNNNVVNFNNPCGVGPDGTPHVWFGSNAGTGTRLLQTVDFNMIAGGNLNFDFKMAQQGGTNPCEGPDEADEGVSLQYSTDYGATWVDIIYFSPGGTLLPSNPGGNNSIANGATAFTVWANYTFAVPPGAMTTCTRFRWFQPFNTSATNDHWGLDNVIITSNLPPAPGISTFTWLDNGQPVTGPRTVTPTQTTTYFVQYATPTDTCIDSVRIIVNPVPNAVYSGPSNVCVGVPNTFSAAGSTIGQGGTIATYRYILNPGGATNYLGTNSSHNFTYPIAVPTFQASIIVSSNAGCADTVSFPITVSPAPVPSFTMPTAVCVGQTVNLDASASTIAAPGVIGSYVWDYDNNAQSDDSLTTTTSSFVPANVGTQNVKLSIYNTVGCSTSVSNPLIIHALPVSDFTATAACVGGAAPFVNNNIVNGVVYNYDFGDATNANNNTANFTHVYNQGTYTITQIANQQGLCADTSQVTIQVIDDITANFSFNEVCNLNGIFIDNSSIPAGSAGTVNSWLWSFGDGSTDNTQNPSHLYTNSNDFNVTLIAGSSQGCFDTITLVVPKYALPIADFTFSEVCLGQVTKLANTSTVTGGVINQFNWSLGDGDFLVTSDGDHSYDAASAYTVTFEVTTDKGCKDTIVKTVNVWPVPTAGFSIDPPNQTDMLAPNVIITDQSTGGNIYEYFIPNQGTYDEASPEFAFEQSGNYSIFQTVTNTQGCFAEMQMEYIVLPAYTFYVPSAFTPAKGDLINPIFQVYGKGLGKMDFRIFNRWGEEIFTSFDVNFIWDGTYKGKDLPMGVYAYRCIVRDIEGNEYIYNGEINLIR